MDTVPAGASPLSCTCSGSGTFSASAGDCGAVTDVVAQSSGTANISATLADPDGDAAGPATQPVTVNVQTDLVTTITADKTDADVGEVITYTLTVLNNGPDDATGVTLTSLCPVGTTFQSADPAYNSATGEWSPGNISNSASTSISFSCTVDAGQGGNNLSASTTAASGNEPDTVTGGDSLVSGDTLVNKYVDVTTSISMESEVCGRKDIVVVFEADNNGPDSISALDITLPCPTNTSFVSYSGLGSYDSVTGVWSAGAVASGGNVYFDLVCKSTDASTTQTGTVAVTSADISMLEVDTNLANDGSSASIDMRKSVAELGSPTHTQTTLDDFSTSYPYPAGGANRVLMVMIGTDYQTGGEISTVTYGGESLVRVRKEQVVKSGYDTGTEFWYLDDTGISAAVGDTLNIVTTLESPGNVWHNVVIVPVANVDQSVLFFSDDGDAQESTNLSATIDYNECSYAISAFTKGNPDTVSFSPATWESFGPFTDPQSTFYYGVFAEPINDPQTVTATGSNSFRFTGIAATFQVAP
jgi:uncharacterized repeat protein (TIGR01451 family)